MHGQRKLALRFALVVKPTGGVPGPLAGLSNVCAIAQSNDVMSPENVHAARVCVPRVLYIRKKPFVWFL